MAKFITLDNLERFLEKGDAHWLVRGDYDASTGVGYAEEANNLVATEGLDVLNAFSYDSVGGDASASISDGNATIKELVGVDVVRNQEIDVSLISTGTQNGITLTRNSDGTMTVSGTSTDRAAFSANQLTRFVNGHWYLVTTAAGMFVHNGGWDFSEEQPFSVFQYQATTGYGDIIYDIIRSGVSFNVTFTPLLIDLTQRYGSNDVVNAIIGSTAAKWVSRLFAFDPTILKNAAYNDGALVPSKSAKLKVTGKNLFPFEQPIVTGNGMQGGAVSKELWLKSGTRYTISLTSDSGNAKILITLGDYGTEVPYISSGSPLEVSFLPPSIGYVKIRFTFVDFGTAETYRNIMLNEGSTALPYEPYEESIANLPDIELHGMLTVQNGKIVPLGNTANPLGGGKGRVGIVNLGMLIINKENISDTYRFYCDPPRMSTTNNLLTLLCGRYIADLSPITLSKVDRTMAGYAGRLYINDFVFSDAESLKAALNGVYLVYELAEETELESPSFQEFIPIKKGGTLEFLDSNDATASLQGADIFYQKDIKGFVEGVGSREDVNWIPTNVASKQDVENGVKDVEDGEVVARLAKDLTPYSDESGSEQSKPFTAQGTATDAGTAEVTVGSFAQLKEKQGNTVAWNQGAKPIASTNWNYAGTGSVSFNDGLATITTGAANDFYEFVKQSYVSVVGNKCLFMCNAKITPVNAVSKAKIDLSFRQYGVYKGNKEIEIDVNKKTFVAGIIEAENNPSTDIAFGLAYDSTSSCGIGTTVEISDAKTIDLTQLFPDNTPTSITGPRVLWAIQYATLHPEYNAGELIDGDGVKLACSGRNLWDEKWRNGAYDSQTGAYSTDTNVCNQNPIKVLPNQEYYFKGASISSYGTPAIYFYDADGNYLGFYSFPNYTQSGEFTTPTNCSFINFVLPSAYGTTYNHDITISLWYASGQDYDDEYFPYEEPNVYDTGNEVLRSAGSVRDSKAPDGTITRRVGTYTFTGSESWAYQRTGLSGDVYRATFLTEEHQSTPNLASGVICSNGYYNPYSGVYAGNALGIAFDYAECYVCVPAGESPNTIFANGVVCYYVRYAPTTKQGTPFPENISVNDYGMMAWLKADGTYAEVPQGALFFYPADYKGMLDDIYYRTTPAGNANDLVVQSELAASETARDAVDAQLKEALGGTLRQLLAVKESIGFVNTAYVDLGTLNWGAEGITNCFSTNISDMVNATQSDAGALCSKYPFSSVVSFSNAMDDKSMLFYVGTKNLYIKDSSFAGKTSAEVQALLKGVLLAYEKA